MIFFHASRASNGFLPAITAPLVISSVFWLLAARPADAYPQFQIFVEKHSGRMVNCALCHTNDNGPQGDGKGQIGSLTAEQLATLNEARAATEPGSKVENPILNAFGNHIIQTLGTAKFTQMIADPAKLATALGDKSDLDGDGIPDSREYLDGTDPLNKYNGDPWLLFVNNISRYKVQVALMALAVFLLTFGFNDVLRGIARLPKSRTSDQPDRAG